MKNIWCKHISWKGAQGGWWLEIEENHGIGHVEDFNYCPMCGKKRPKCIKCDRES